jgi:opacity protein-like surface antigen
MKPKCFLIFGVCIILNFLNPVYAFSQDYDDYFVFKIGTYDPTGDIDDVGLGSGSNWEVAWGNYSSENFSIEFGIGNFETDGTFSTSPTVTEKDDVQATQLSFILKGHIPVERGEFYGGGGIGWYFAKLDIDLDGPGGSLEFSDTDDFYGFQIVAGFNFNITDEWFLGIEGKLLRTADFDFSDIDQGILLTGEFDFDGYILTGQIGFRF